MTTLGRQLWLSYSISPKIMEWCACVNATLSLLLAQIVIFEIFARISSCLGPFLCLQQLLSSSRCGSFFLFLAIFPHTALSSCLTSSIYLRSIPLSICMAGVASGGKHTAPPSILYLLLSALEVLATNYKAWSISNRTEPGISWFLNPLLSYLRQIKPLPSLFHWQ